jgi:hypothetical protein
VVHTIIPALRSLRQEEHELRSGVIIRAMRKHKEELRVGGSRAAIFGS